MSLLRKNFVVRHHDLQEADQRHGSHCSHRRCDNVFQYSEKNKQTCKCINAQVDSKLSQFPTRKKNTLFKEKYKRGAVLISASGAVL